MGQKIDTTLDKKDLQQNAKIALYILILKLLDKPTIRNHLGIIWFI